MYKFRLHMDWWSIFEQRTFITPNRREVSSSTRTGTSEAPSLAVCLGGKLSATEALRSTETASSTASPQRLRDRASGPHTVENCLRGAPRLHWFLGLLRQHSILDSTGAACETRSTPRRRERGLFPALGQLHPAPPELGQGRPATPFGSPFIKKQSDAESRVLIPLPPRPGDALLQV